MHSNFYLILVKGFGWSPRRWRHPAYGINCWIFVLKKEIIYCSMYLVIFLKNYLYSKFLKKFQSYLIILSWCWSLMVMEMVKTYVCFLIAITVRNGGAIFPSSFPLRQTPFASGWSPWSRFGTKIILNLQVQPNLVNKRVFVKSNFFILYYIFEISLLPILVYYLYI